METLKNIVYQSIINSNGQIPQWSKIKRSWVKILPKFPRNSDILQAYLSLVKDNKLSLDKAIEDSLRVRKVRTLSGVAPFAVMMKPFPCPGNCIYCVQEKGMPKSYMSDEPAAARAKQLEFSAKKQIEARIKQFIKTGHEPEKLEIIIIGGTFSAYPKDYKYDFIKEIFDTVNGTTSKDLEDAQKQNEAAKYRIVGLSVETRPDWVTEEEIIFLRKAGVTRIQLGVQAFDNDILKKINRGHSLDEVSRATQLLRDAGFKINYHFMPNLPGSTPKKDLKMAKIMFEDERFKPDTLKIYPCIVLPNTPLEILWKNGTYQSYDDKTLTNLIINIKKIVPYFCRIDRLVRDITKNWNVSGTQKTNMRQLVQDIMKKNNITCNCIRCREIKNEVDSKNTPVLNTHSYIANAGVEHFISFDSENKLYGMLRLRFPSKNKSLFKILENSALIREVHVFGQQLGIAKESESAVQHQKYGKRLIQKAEELALSNGYKKMAIISAVGTRQYYQKLGYHLEETYMVKSLA
jgi:elongator complex protein 3